MTTTSEVAAEPSVPAGAWSSHPVAEDGRGFLYVLRLKGGVIKIGKTVDPASRLRQHVSDASAYCVTITHAWLSVEHQGFAENEVLALAEMGRRHKGPRARREYFHGADYDEAVDVVNRAMRGGIDQDQTNLFFAQDPALSDGGTQDDPSGTHYDHTKSNGKYKNVSSADVHSATVDALESHLKLTGQILGTMKEIFEAIKGAYEIMGTQACTIQQLCEEVDDLKSGN